MNSDIMVKNRTLLIIFLVAFLSALVVLVPVRLLWHYVGPADSALVEPQALTGNLWSGSALVPWDGEQYQLHWRLAPRQLLSGHLGYDLAVMSPGVDVTGQVGYRPGSIRVDDLGGFADMAALDDVLQPWNVSLGGQLWADELSVHWRPGEGRLEGNALLDWRNGNADFDWIDGSRQSTALPLLQGMIRTDEAGQTTAVLTNADTDMPLLLAELSADGELMYRLYTHIRDVLQIDMPGGGEVIMESQINVQEYLR